MRYKIFLVVLLISLIFSCSKKEEAAVEEPSAPVIVELPATIIDEVSFRTEPEIRNDTKIFNLERGVKATFLGITQEATEKDNKDYGVDEWSKIKIQGGQIGWVTTTRLALESDSGVFIDDPEVFQFPGAASPIKVSAADEKLFQAFSVALKGKPKEEVAGWTMVIGRTLANTFWVKDELISYRQEDMVTAANIRPEFEKLNNAMNLDDLSGLEALLEDDQLNNQSKTIMTKAVDKYNQAVKQIRERQNVDAETSELMNM